jgi:anti-sigma B factor antagonist
MKIVKKMDGTEMIAAVEGRVDSVTAPELAAALRDPADDFNSLVMDFSKLDYISSAGLRVLLAEGKAMEQKGGMVIRHANEGVLEVFEMTGFSNILNIEK